MLGVPFLFYFDTLSPTHNCCNRWYEYRFGLLIEKPTEKSQFSSPRNVRWGSFNCGNKDSTRMSRWNYTERMWSGSRKWKISPKLLFEIITLRGSLVVRRLNKNGGNKYNTFFTGSFTRLRGGLFCVYPEHRLHNPNTQKWICLMEWNASLLRHGMKFPGKFLLGYLTLSPVLGSKKEERKVVKIRSISPHPLKIQIYSFQMVIHRFAVWFHVCPKALQRERKKKGKNSNYF